jgi:hypothetical protein
MVSRVGRIGSTVAGRGIVLMVTRTHAYSGAFAQILHLSLMYTAGPTVVHSTSVHIQPTSNPRSNATMHMNINKGMYSHSSNKIVSKFMFICSFLYTCTAGPVILLAIHSASRL